MTSKEVLRELVLKYNVPQNVLEPLRLLDKRDTPMNPLKVNNTKLIYWCSKCDCSSIQRYDKFCHECGQRLDWEEE